MSGVLVHLSHRHLMRAPVALGAPAVDLFRTGPALWCAKHDHRPERAFGETILARVGFDALDFTHDRVERRGHELVHLFRIITLDEIRRVPIAAEKMIQFFVADPGQDARIGDLVAVEVEDRQNHSIRRRVQEFIGVPARRQRTGLCLAVAYNTGNDQIGVVEGCSVGVRDGIAEFATLVN